MANMTREEVADLERRLAELHIVQRGDSILECAAEQLQLPQDGMDAAALFTRLRLIIQLVSKEWKFAKGVGIAAPQIGVSKAVAMIRPASGKWLGLINPHIIDEMGPVETRWEGCLSFFGCRGEVARHRTITVADELPDGTKQVRCFSGARARLVLHECDHLNGVLYTSRMTPEARLVPLEEYDGAGIPWK